MVAKAMYAQATNLETDMIETAETRAPAIRVTDLDIEIASDHGSFPVVSEMNLSVAAGETLCIVGESGCGKSMTALSLMQLLPEAARVTAGSIEIDGTDFRKLPRRTVEDWRGEKIAMIFQEPLTALNPVLTVGEQIIEAVRQHRKCSRKAAFARVVEVLKLVQMPDPERRAKQYPHELSGGMRQRAMIALAIACDPKIIVADEPTTALDVTIQAQILGLISELQKRLGTAQILITHDLGVVAEVADKVIVMYAGRRVEEASVYDLFDRPLHPYTRGLLGAMPRAKTVARADGRLTDIPGTVPPLFDLPKGCAFASRCPNASERCRAERPPFEEKAPGHWAACWEHDDAA
ncbi:UNVERIFIED_ORG: peptide/nickel transport system ATP-binding protein [Martelella mediterranea]